jgi:hypothetical protein
MKEVKKLVENFWLLGQRNRSRSTILTLKRVQQTQIDFVDMPNAVQSEIAVVNTINLKLPINNILLQSCSKSDSWWRRRKVRLF